MPDRREQRAHHVLEAAAELFTQHGFDRTTLGEVAQAAGISKSTLYLYWNTREALLAAVLRRGRLALLTRVCDQMNRSPEAASPGALYRVLAQELYAAPLLRQITDPYRSTLLRGMLAEKQRVRSPEDPLSHGAVPYLAELRSSGLVRADLEPAELGDVLHGVVSGFLFTEADRGGERRAALLADTVERVLAPAHPLTSEQRAEQARITLAHLDLFVAAARIRFDASLPAA